MAVTRDIFNELMQSALRMPAYYNPIFPPSRYYRFLRLLAEREKPQLMVELGFCGGGASLHMALGNPDGVVVGVDKCVEYPDNLSYVRAKCPNFQFLLRDSVEAAELVGGPVGLLFIDTTHTYEQTMAEWTAWEPWLAKSAVVCLDDLERPGMDRVWEEMEWNKVRLDLLHTEGGFGVLWRP